MSKFLKIPNGNYKVKVQEGGTITLDTGLDSGQVVITGDLIVEGETITINTTDLLIEDNTILLNNGETGAGISQITSGIQIDRGTLPDAFIQFDETISWLVPNDVDSIGGTTVTGGFVLKNNNDQLVALRTNAIDTDGGDLNLINKGTGIITVTGTSNYEDRVVDPDHIPNKAYVDIAISQIGDNVTVTGLGDFDTEIFVRDSERSGISDSFIGFTIDGVEVSRLNGTQLTLHNLEIENEIIRSTGAATNIVLKHSGLASSVLVDTTLGLKSIGSSLFAPDQPSDGVRIYNDEESIGGTGIYFVNEEGTRDEMVSRSRAILYGIIF